MKGMNTMPVRNGFRGIHKHISRLIAKSSKSAGLRQQPTMSSEHRPFEKSERVRARPSAYGKETRELLDRAERVLTDSRTISRSLNQIERALSHKYAVERVQDMKDERASDICMDSLLKETLTEFPGKRDLTSVEDNMSKIQYHILRNGLGHSDASTVMRIGKELDTNVGTTLSPSDSEELPPCLDDARSLEWLHRVVVTSDSLPMLSSALQDVDDDVRRATYVN